jgi:hypothetical protein
MSGLSASQTFANSNSIRCDIVIQARQEDLPMPDQFWLTKAQLKRIEPFSGGRQRPSLTVTPPHSSQTHLGLCVASIPELKVAPRRMITAMTIKQLSKLGYSVTEI